MHNKKARILIILSTIILLLTGFKNNPYFIVLDDLYDLYIIRYGRVDCNDRTYFLVHDGFSQRCYIRQLSAQRIGLDAAHHSISQLVVSIELFYLDGRTQSDILGTAAFRDDFRIPDHMFELFDT